MDNNNKNKMAARSGSDSNSNLPTVKEDKENAVSGNYGGQTDIGKDSGEEVEISNEELNRQIINTLQYWNPFVKKKEYGLYLPDGSHQVIKLGAKTDISELTERLNAKFDHMMYVAARMKEYNEYREPIGRMVTQEVVLPWSMDDLKKMKMSMVICFRSEIE